MQPITILVKSSSAELFTVVYPKEGAETIILLHGGPGVPMAFPEIATFLAQKYQVIVFDQRGTGRSPVSSSSFAIADYIDDLEAIRKHFNLETFHLLGHSWGGLYAQCYIAKHSDRVISLFLLSPSSGTGAEWNVMEKEIMAFNRARVSLCTWMKMGIDSLLGSLGSDAAHQSLFKQVLQNYHKDTDPQFVPTDAMVINVRAEAVNKTLKAIKQYPLLPQYIDIRTPIMIVYGAHDIYGTSKVFVQKRFPTASNVIIDHAGHIVWEQNKEQFFRVLRNFYSIT